MLRWRLVGAVTTIVPLVLILWLEDHRILGRPGSVLLPVGALAAMLAAGELCHLMGRAADGLRAAPVVLAAGAAILVSGAPVAWREYPSDCPLGTWGWTSVALAAVVIGLFLVEMARYRQPGGATIRLAISLLAVMYVTLPLLFLLHLRRLDGARWGVLMVASVVLVVKSSDAGAYFVGRFLGRLPMAPVLSPKKTWEGAAGGLAAGVGASWLFFDVLAPAWGGSRAAPFGLQAVLGYGGLLSVAGMLGDLAESLLKRDLQTKDSGRVLPGLGGALDVLDSILFAAPLAYLWWVASG